MPVRQDPGHRKNSTAAVVLERVGKLQLHLLVSASFMGWALPSGYLYISRHGQNTSRCNFFQSCGRKKKTSKVCPAAFYKELFSSSALEPGTQSFEIS